jgi:hypothetical protein
VPEITGPVVTGAAARCDTPGCGWQGVATTFDAALQMVINANVHADGNGHWVQAKISWYAENGPDPREASDG